MSSFESAFIYAKRYEISNANPNGYVDNPFDRGGETFYGIARDKNPDWDGWPLIDTLKKYSYNLKNVSLSILTLRVREFYKDRYWDAILGYRIRNQRIANELFEQAINLGKRAAVKNLQESLNLLNRNGKRWEELVMDGIMGSKTLGVLHAGIIQVGSDEVYKLFNTLQGEYYINILRRDPSQEEFTRSWLRRV